MAYEVDFNNVSTTGLEKLKWINLGSTTAKKSAIKDTEVSGASSSKFASLLQSLSVDSSGVENANSLTQLMDATASTNGLLWQQLGITADSYNH